MRHSLRQIDDTISALLKGIVSVERLLPNFILGHPHSVYLHESIPLVRRFKVVSLRFTVNLLRLHCGEYFLFTF